MCVGDRYLVINKTYIMPIDITIYGGMSGGPVLLGDEVIAVLSGSLNEGGSFAWGIPIDYINYKTIWTYIGQIPPNIAWPKYGLLSKFSRSTETLVSYSASDGALVETYFSQSEELKEQFADATNKFSDCAAARDIWSKIPSEGAGQEYIKDYVWQKAEKCLASLVPQLEKIGKLETNISVTHNEIQAAIKSRGMKYINSAPITNVVHINEEFPSIFPYKAVEQIDAIYKRMKGVNLENESEAASFVQQSINVLAIDSKEVQDRVANIFYDVRLISMYFNKLLLQQE
jgi:hypothetical protein